jgi:hypothetical protein
MKNTLLPLMVLSLQLLAVACGGSPDGEPGSESQTPGPSATTTAPEATAIEGLEVHLEDSQRTEPFVPEHGGGKGVVLPAPTRRRNAE